MQKRGKARIVGIVITAVLVLAVLHTTMHLLVYGTGISGFGASGVSGFSVGKLNIDEEFKQSNAAISPLSQWIIIGEWALLISMILFGMFRERITLPQKSTQETTLTLPAKTDSSKTELDVLYDLLREKKSLKISAIAKTFDVDHETVEEWAQILENNNLATLLYPRIGEAELHAIEKPQEAHA